MTWEARRVYIVGEPVRIAPALNALGMEVDELKHRLSCVEPETRRTEPLGKPSAKGSGLGWFLGGIVVALAGVALYRHLKGNTAPEDTGQKLTSLEGQAQEVRYLRVRLDNGLERLAKIEGYITPPPDQS